MAFILDPWQLLIFILAGWINRHQQDAIEYLRTENQILKEKLGKRRILLNDDQRRRLAVKGQVLTRKTLQQVTTIVTPNILLRWHRELIARKWHRQATVRRSTTCSTGDRDPDCSHGSRESQLGLRPHSGRPVQRGLSRLSHHGRQHSQSPRHRTRPTTSTLYIVVNLLESSLGLDCCG